VRRGPHKSAATKDAVKLFEEDVTYQVEAGFSRIVNWDDIKDNPPAQLKVSPAAVVPQAKRRDRIILDLSFPVRVGAELIQQAVNDTTTPTAHPSSMDQLGSTMPRILEFMAHAPPEHPIFFSKYDVSDGFWRMVVAKGSEWNFAYVLPQEEGEPIRLVVPNALQMGWRESPGYFCSASETARDVAAELAGFEGRMADLPPHAFEQHIEMPDVHPGEAAGPAPWAAIEVFVDDFIAMSQDAARIPHTTRAILHGIEQVFPHPDITGHTNGKTPVSEKKVMKGEADWRVRKEVLGWLVDGRERTLELTPDKATAYAGELKKLLRRKKIPLARFRKIVGKLRFAALCLPAGRALMSPLNRAVRGEPPSIGNGQHSEVRENLGDWLQLLKELAARPTSVHELVARSVDYYGYCDACNTGVGGVWLPMDSELEPFLWRVAWPADIAKKLQSYDGLSINDGECAGLLLQQMALEVAVADLRHKNALSFCDNTAAVAWVCRMASKSSRIGGRLVKGLAVRARQRRMCLPGALSIAGTLNEMADVSSRSFAAASGFLMDDAALLAHFHSQFPLPQNRRWKIVTLPPEDILSVVSTLRGQRSTMAQWTNPAGSPTGSTGGGSPGGGTSPHGSTDARQCSERTSSLPLLSGSAKATSDAATASLRSQWTAQSEPWARPSNWQAGKTQRKSLAAASASFNSAASSRRSAARTRRQSRSWRSR
jgi:hypothetical protein